MRQLFLTILLVYATYCANFEYYDGNPERTIEKCIQNGACHAIEVVGMCRNKNDRSESMEDSKCIMDISRFSQKFFSKMLEKVTTLMPWITCSGSALTEVNFSNCKVGHIVKVATVQNSSVDLPLQDYPHATITLVNNFNLRNVTLYHELGKLRPGLLKIRNNPRLSRVSIKNIWHLLNSNPEIEEKADIQTYGECNFHYHPVGSTKSSLSWEEFRWCRNVAHGVVLEGSQFNSTIVDAAYILEVQGTLSITNTNLTNLRMLPLYFKMNRGVISNNRDLCISFEDEIRMKRLGFTMENNKPLDCRTICQGGKLSLKKIKSLRNCITIEGGLELENIDEATAAADLFKSVKKIDGSLIIRNAIVPVVFKQLKSIDVSVTEGQPHLLIENCQHPIVFNKLVELEGKAASPHMVFLKGGKTNIFKHLNAKYPGKVYDSVRDQSKSSTVTSKPLASVNLQLTSKIEQSTGATATPVAMPVATKTENNVANAESIKPASAERTSSRLSYSTYPPPGPNAAEISDINSSRGDVKNSSVDEKKTVLVVMTCVSFFIFFASSVTSIGILLKYRIM